MTPHNKANYGGGGLKAEVIRSTKWTSASFVASFISQFLNYLLIAQALGPVAMGKIAIVTILNGFADIFLTMGLSQAVIQRQSVTRRELMSLFWLNVGSGSIVSLTVWFSSAGIAGFFKSPDSSTLILVAAPIFVVSALGQMSKAMLEKELSFSRVAAVETIAAVLLPATTLVLIAIGFDVLSAVIGLLVSTSTRSIGFLVAGWGLFRPGLHFSLNETKRFVSFGLLQAVDTLLNFASSNVTTIAVGRAVSTAAMGGFSLAFNNAVTLPARINPIMTRVMFPVSSRIQNDRARVASNYLKLVSVAAFVSFPILTTLALVSEDFVHVFYGPEWLWISPLISSLCFVGALRAVGNPAGSLLLATDNMRLGILMNVAKALITIPAVGAGAMTAGLSGAVMALIISQVSSFLITYFVVRRVSHVRIAPYFASCFAVVPRLAPAVAGVIAFEFVFRSSEMESYVLLLSKCAISGALVMLMYGFSRNSVLVEMRGALRRSEQV